MAASGDYFTDWRRDPIDSTFYPIEITAESNDVVPILGSNGKVGFFVIEVPSPDFSVTIIRTHYVSGGVLVPDGSPPTYTQVTTNPNTEEYAVNFERGLIILNADEYDLINSIGSRFEVAYYGLGTSMNVRNTYFIELAALDQKVSRDGSLAMTGDLDFDSNKIINLANGTNPGDGINRSQLDTKLSLDGSLSMTGALNMNTFKITNLQAGSASADAVRYSQLAAIDKSTRGQQQYDYTGTTGNQTISDLRYYYEILTYSGGTGYNYDITGIPNVDLEYFYLLGVFPGAAGAQTISIHSNLILQTPNPVFGGAFFIKVMKFNGVWRRLIS